MDSAQPLRTAAVVFVAAATVMGLEEIRVFLSYLVWTLGETVPRPVLGAIAGVPFFGAALGGVALKLLGPRRGALLSTAWLCATYLAEKNSESAQGDLVLGGLAVLFWGWSLVGAVVVLPRGVPLGVVVGASIDVAVRIGFLTMDLPWTNHPSATVLAGVLAVAAIWGARESLRTDGATGEASWRKLIPMLGIGPWLAMFMLVSGNISQLMARTGSDFGVIAGALAVGQAAGLRLVAGAAARPSILPGLTLLSGVALLALAPLWSGAPGGPLWVAIVVAAVNVLLAGSLRSTELLPERGSAVGVSLAIAVGLGLFLLAAYSYYALFGLDWLVVLLAVVLAAAGAGGAGVALLAKDDHWEDLAWSGNAVAMLVMVVGVYRALSWNEVAVTGGAPVEITAMTFNVRAGFGADGRWDLERVARAIEAENPDVVVLQEVTRGWILASGTDEAVWLSQRLGMRYLFGPGAGDLHGNLLLSRYEVDGSSYRYAAAYPGSLPRGAIVAQLATDAGPLLVLGTHLDHPEGAAATRLAQAEELVRLGAVDRPSIVLGDLNAEISAPELRPLFAAGYLDAPGRLGDSAATWPTWAPRRRIDHVLVGPSVTALSARTPTVAASDHLPVVVRIRMP